MISAEVVDKHWNLVIDRPLEITFLINSGDKQTRNVAVSHSLEYFRFKFSSN